MLACRKLMHLKIAGCVITWQIKFSNITHFFKEFQTFVLTLCCKSSVLFAFCAFDAVGWAAGMASSL